MCVNTRDIFATYSTVELFLLYLVIFTFIYYENFIKSVAVDSTSTSTRTMNYPAVCNLCSFVCDAGLESHAGQVSLYH